MEAQKYPLVGNAVWIARDGKVLLAKRAPQKRSGAGTWAPPGGHVEMFETIASGAVREVHEEAGVEISEPSLITFMEDYASGEPVHYITFHYAASWLSGEPRPLKGESEEWTWFSWNDLPQPLFRPAQLFVETGVNPLEFI